VYVILKELIVALFYHSLVKKIFFIAVISFLWTLTQEELLGAKKA
jgi:hypothetical protein